MIALSDGQTWPVDHVHIMGHQTIGEKVAEFAGRPLPPMLQTASGCDRRSGRRERSRESRSASGTPWLDEISHLFKFPGIAMAASGVDVYADPDWAGT